MIKTILKLVVDFLIFVSIVLVVVFGIIGLINYLI